MSEQSFHALLHSMLSSNADVLLLSEGATPRIRTAESWIAIRDRAWSAAEADALLGAILSAQDSREYETAGEAAFLHRTPDSGWFNIRVLRTCAGSTIVAKRVREEIPSLDELGLPRAILQVALRAMLRVRGLILVTGASRSGRSTSLAAMLGFLNREICAHIVVLEDDPRWLYRSGSCILSQFALGASPASRRATVNSVKGWGADVVAIDCASDIEMLAAAIELAESGMAVIAVGSALQWIATRGAAVIPGVAERLADLLRLATSQRLVSRQDRDGRVPAVEVIVNDHAVGSSILKREFHEIREIAKRSSDMGMQTAEQALADLHLAGVISHAEALRNAGSASETALFIKEGQRRAYQTLDRTPRAVFAALMAEHGVPRIVIANASIRTDARRSFASDASMGDQNPFEAGVSHYRTRHGAERQLAIRKYVEVAANEIPAVREAVIAMGVVEVLRGTRQGPDGKPTSVARVAVQADVAPLGDAEFADAVRNRRMLDVDIERSIFGDTFVRFSITKGNVVKIGGDSMRFLFDPPCQLSYGDVLLTSSYGELQSGTSLLEIFREYFTRPLGASAGDDRNANLAALAAGLRRIPRPKGSGEPLLHLDIE